ncbi:radial spoke head protein, putative [Ichthyophthirius multifiliis]|uniref:Radial spoke head protein, putative n=1 Tax=Ichthyophthirius multifiliis TaxID=5932 RepID=G0R1R4_ICHMU|nr:radial spoke head protein, putative [Ichthyophthirius multifiliis]EGR28566.1 radial spoke head protein, putative [Ichthyophthirius multifiliis]|eukprot:XP_004029802.1 radial spoke head protein, putative [Ichthyophthirius multifiliis]
MEYFGEIDLNYSKIGIGTLKSEFYQFNGFFDKNFPEGYGKEICNKIIYEGNFKQGLYDGYGILSFPNGRVYKGFFNKHMFHGQGELIGDEGNKYEGIWNQGILLEGKIVYVDGSFYKGTIKNNFLKNGIGSKFYYREQGVYIGNFLNNLRHGEGTFLYDNGSKFEGKWENNEFKQGNYHLKIENEEYFLNSGFWINKIKKGIEQRYFFQEKGLYKGEFLNGKMNGFGIFKYANGNVYEGQWKDNLFQGDGIFYFKPQDQFRKGDVYNGQFQKGKFQGFGCYLNNKQNKYFIGKNYKLQIYFLFYLICRFLGK